MLHLLARHDSLLGMNKFWSFDDLELVNVLSRINKNAQNGKFMTNKKLESDAVGDYKCAVVFCICSVSK